MKKAKTYALVLCGFLVPITVALALGVLMGFTRGASPNEAGMTAKLHVADSNVYEYFKGISTDDVGGVKQWGFFGYSWVVFVQFDTRVAWNGNFIHIAEIVIGPEGQVVSATCYGEEI